MKTRDYIDAARKLAKTPSDYAVAKLLGISEDAVNQYRKGKRVMDNMTCLRLSELLALPLEELIASAELERAKDDKTREKWAQRLKRYGQRAASVTGIIVMAALGAIGAKETFASENASALSIERQLAELTIMRHFRRAVTRLAAMGATRISVAQFWRSLLTPA